MRVRPPLLVAAAVTDRDGGRPGAGRRGRCRRGRAGAGASRSALVLLVHRRVDARRGPRGEHPAGGGAAGDRRPCCTALPDLRAHGLADRAAADLDRLADRQAGRRPHRHPGGRRSAPAWSVLGTGLAAVLATAVGARGGLTGPALAVLALAPLALAEPLAGIGRAPCSAGGALADAHGRARRRPRPRRSPADPAEPLPRAGARARAGGRRADRRLARRPRRPARPRRGRARPATAGWSSAARPGSGKSTFLAVLMAALRPARRRATCSSGADTARLAGDDVRVAHRVAAAGGARLRLVASAPTSRWPHRAAS